MLFLNFDFLKKTGGKLFPVPLIQCVELSENLILDVFADCQNLWIPFAGNFRFLF